LDYEIYYGINHRVTNVIETISRRERVLLALGKIHWYIYFGKYFGGH